MVGGGRSPRPAFVVLAGAILTCSAPAHAHEKWFYDASLYPTRWDQALQFPAIVGVAAAVALTAVAWVAWRMRGRRDVIPGPRAFGATEAGRARFYAVVPVILGLHVGISLVVLGINGQLFSPNNQLDSTPRYWLGTAQIGVGLTLIYGMLTRAAAVVLGCVWLAGIGVLGLEPMLENVHYPGFAAFFLLAGRGPYAIDRLLFPVLEPSRALARRAIGPLRVATGLSLAIVAFTEKLANVDFATAFVQTYRLNFTSWLGLPVSDQTFAVGAGATELLVGLWVMLGVFPRLIIVTAWLFINMTLTIFTWFELLGHLPVYGVIGVLLVWTPGDEDRRLWERGVLGSDDETDVGKRARTADLTEPRAVA